MFPSVFWLYFMCFLLFSSASSSSSCYSYYYYSYFLFLFLFSFWLLFSSSLSSFFYYSTPFFLCSFFLSVLSSFFSTSSPTTLFFSPCFIVDVWCFSCSSSPFFHLLLDFLLLVLIILLLLSVNTSCLRFGPPHPKKLVTAWNPYKKVVSGKGTMKAETLKTPLRTVYAKKRILQVLEKGGAEKRLKASKNTTL